jgi:transcriptional regulator with XRE-family HTH domain
MARERLADADEVIAAPMSAGRGARVHLRRKQLGLSRRQVARAAGFTARELGSAERGRRGLTVEELRALAGALGVEPSEIAPGEATTDFGAGHVHAARIDAMFGDDSDPAAADVDQPHHDRGQLSVSDLMAPYPFEVSVRERRRDRRTRARVERTWAAVALDIEEVVDRCRRVVDANSGDDIAALLEDLEQVLVGVRSTRTFQRDAAGHGRALARARRGPTVSPRP